MAVRAPASEQNVVNHPRSDGSGATPDPIESAREAGLRYVSDDRPGIRRWRAGTGFRYLRPDGSPVRDKPTLRRITTR